MRAPRFMHGITSTRYTTRITWSTLLQPGKRVSNTDVFPLERNAILQNKAPVKERNYNIWHSYQLTGPFKPSSYVLENK
jgi:hypothetical protein